MPTISGVHYMKMKSGERGQPITIFCWAQKIRWTNVGP